MDCWVDKSPVSTGVKKQVNNGNNNIPYNTSQGMGMALRVWHIVYLCSWMGGVGNYHGLVSSLKDEAAGKLGVITRFLVKTLIGDHLSILGLLRWSISNWLGYTLLLQESGTILQIFGMWLIHSYQTGHIELCIFVLPLWWCSALSLSQ